MVETTQRVDGGALVERVLRGYGDVRGSYRREWAREPDEARLLFFVLLACAMLFLARLPELVAVNTESGRTGPAMIMGNLVGAVFFAPILLYAIAGLSHLVAKLVGGTASWRASRLALFWAMLLGVPLVLISGAVTSLGRATGLTDISGVFSGLVSLVVLWFWAKCLGEAEGFRRDGIVFIALLSVPVIAMVLLYFAGRGA